ncbi:MAG: hypothetical protein LBJ98_04035 [Endomicrobium sp.]|jgi:hypothetical protein|nr:hypothetical protein [Endomicrobium sp.]
MGNKTSKPIDYSVAIITAIVAIIVFCIIAVIFKVVPIDVLPANFIGATLGALIGALITLILLRGQTDIEEKKGKDIRILETKTKVFQHFIEAVWKVWKNQVITIEDFRDLTSEYYQNLMIYLKDDKRAKAIGDALTVIGGKIGKNSYKDTKELREKIVLIIDTLSEDLDLGGKIDMKIMEEHDKIVFPVYFRKMLLNKLNEDLNTNDSASDYKEGKYEFIWEGANHEFITFELRKFAGIKLAIGEIGAQKLRMVFMADLKNVQLNNFRHTGYKGNFRKRFGDQPAVSDPIPDDEDKTTAPLLDFSKEDSMNIFRTEKRNFPNVLAKRVLYHLDEWNIDELGIIEFLEKQLGKGDAE